MGSISKISILKSKKRANLFDTMDIARSSQPLQTSSRLMGPASAMAKWTPEGAGDGFQSVWQNTLNTDKVTVQKGDTLVGIVTDHYKKQGVPIDDRQAYRQALALAKAHGIANPDLIQPGLELEVPPLKEGWVAHNTQQALSQRALPAIAPQPAQQPASSGNDSGLLDQTLTRAVSKGYTSAAESAQAKQKILQMSAQFGFEPDHFAMLTMIESDGMNPKASNGQCHGIIQFCEGKNRGAASVGMAGKAQEILGLGLLKQLDLVERYFRDMGMGSKNQKMGLDDLYLSVLTPAARVETRRDVPLPIAGIQAKVLYAEGSRSAGITRDSIVAGLTALAQRHFPQWRQLDPQLLAQTSNSLKD
jgi:hypothetical protein